jgi:hypothetical protein
MCFVSSNPDNKGRCKFAASRYALAYLEAQLVLRKVHISLWTSIGIWLSKVMIWYIEMHAMLLWCSFLNFGNKQLVTSTPRLTTNRSYDQNFLKKILIKSTINIIKLLFQLHFHISSKILFLLFCNRKTTYKNRPRTCWRVYIPPHFIISTYDQVFRCWKTFQMRIIKTISK